MALMRIVHTSDWHAGRIWKNRDRLDELSAVLDHLARFVETQRIDLLLLTGDVFDTPAPPARAEKVVFGFLKRLGAAGVPSVVIAGNHDSAQRIEAWGSLAELAGVRAVGTPKPASKGGVLEIPTRSGHTAVVAALPFAPVRMLVSAAELTADGTLAAQRYADGFAAMLARLSASFRADAVNLVAAHTHLEGAAFGSSERRVHLGEEWAATPQALPAAAQYVALGHIHRPQSPPGGEFRPVRYAGSVMQLDFGEAGEAKSFVVVEVDPGRPARVEQIAYQGARELSSWQGRFRELQAQALELRSRGFLRVRLQGCELPADVVREVRRLVPDALVVEVEESQAAEVTRLDLPRDARPVDVYAAWFRQAKGREPGPELLAAFEDLRRAAEGEVVPEPAEVSR